MNFREWLRIDEATPGARSTAPTIMNLAVPPVYGTYGSDRELGYYQRMGGPIGKAVSQGAAHLVRGGIGREFGDLAARSGLRVAGPTDFERPNLGDMEHVEVVSIPLQTNKRLNDPNGKNDHENIGTSGANMLRYVVAHWNDPDFREKVVFNKEEMDMPEKFAKPEENQDWEHAELFTRVVAQVIAYNKMAQDPKNHEKFDLSNMKLKDTKLADGVLSCYFQVPKRKGGG